MTDWGDRITLGFAGGKIGKGVVPSLLKATLSVHCLFMSAICDLFVNIFLAGSLVGITQRSW